MSVLLMGLSDELLLNGGCVGGCGDSMAGLGQLSFTKPPPGFGQMTPAQSAVVAAPDVAKKVSEAAANARTLSSKTAALAREHKAAAVRLQKEGKPAAAAAAATEAVKAGTDSARYAAASKAYEATVPLARKAEEATKTGNAKASAGYRSAVGSMLTATNAALKTPIAISSDGSSAQAQPNASAANIAATSSTGSAPGALPAPATPNTNFRMPPGARTMDIARAAGFQQVGVPSQLTATGGRSLMPASPMPGVFRNPGPSIRDIVPRQAGYNPRGLTIEEKATWRAQGIGGLPTGVRLEGLSGPGFLDALKGAVGGAIDKAIDVAKGAVGAAVQGAVGAGAQAAGNAVAGAVAPPAAQQQTSQSISSQLTSNSGIYSGGSNTSTSFVDSFPGGAMGLGLAAVGTVGVLAFALKSRRS